MKMMLLTIATVLGISVLAGCMAQKTQLPPPKKKVVTEDDRLKAAIKKNKLFLENLRKKHGIK